MVKRDIRVVVVDDSMFFREILIRAINAVPGMEVVGKAGNAQQAKEVLERVRPDVMTLDVEMPGQSGIQFLRRVVPAYSVSVIMVSSLNGAVFDALDAGAVDFVNKPMANKPEDIERFVRYELINKIRVASIAKISNKNRQDTPRASSTVGGTVPILGGGTFNSNKIVAIGASTGGTEAICSIVSKFDERIPGVVITQHMPPGFTKMYAERLNRQCKVSVKEAETGDVVKKGCVLIAPGDRQMRLVKNGNGYKVECRGSDKVSGHCPSVDVLFDSVANVAERNAIGVILTGMGSDGAKGLLKMKQKGAKTIGQDEASCIVYGMPKVAYDMGAVGYQLNLNQIPKKVYGLLST